MKRILLFLIRIYQLSRPFRPPACRFYPSCSSYASLSLEKHGIGPGLILTAWRLLRCHPFCRGGVDEVPEVFSLNLFSSSLSKRV
jgi:uncharacterized protein